MSVLTLLKPTVTILLLFIGLLVRALFNKHGYGISHIKGPFWAAYTDWWRLGIALGRHPERHHIHLHDKYGSLVRLGPNSVSVSDPAAIKAIYGLNAGCVKV